MTAASSEILVGLVFLISELSRYSKNFETQIIQLAISSGGGFPQAARDAQEAVISYDGDAHRRAVALWILGMIKWELLQNHEAHRNWAEARKIFKQCQTINQPPPQMGDWYIDPVYCAP
jgi:hypothetical protein